MISQNIRMYRREKGISQEDLAARLHVVRQTVSKWEKGLSVPDADVLVGIAEALGVSIHQLLGTEEPLAQELASANEALAQYQQKEQAAKLVNQKRSLILFLSFAAMIAMLVMQNQLVSVALSGGITLAALGVLYRNLALLTGETGDQGMKTIRQTTIFDAIVLLSGIVASILIGEEIIPLTESGEKIFAMLLVSCIILFGGIVSPRLPFNRHTGLRLPWTVLDEAAWHAAHRTIGVISLPIVLLYVAAACTIPQFEAVTLAAMLTWVGIPAVISFICFWRGKAS